MGIQKITIEGFRSLGEVSWTPSRLNVLIGPNASGKSNFLRALQLLQQSAYGNLKAAVLAQSGMDMILWRGSSTRERARKLRWSVVTDPVKRGGDPVTEALTYELRLSQIGDSTEYRIDQEMLAKCHDFDHGTQPSPLKFLERVAGRAVVFAPNQRQLLAPEGTIPDDQTLLSLASSPMVRVFSNDAIAGFHSAITSWAIYHDVHVDHGAVVRQAAVTRFERRLASDGQNLIPVLHTLYETDSGFAEAVSQAMRVVFPDFRDLKFPPAADNRIQLKVQWGSLDKGSSAADLSDGTLRFLALLSVLANPEPGALVAIDEPEAGLHPGMFAVLAETAVEAAERTQLILSTHSPQMLDALQRASADAPELLSVTVCSCPEGETRFHVVSGDEVTDWLKAFSLGQLMASGALEAMGP